jgi:large subunit ribosomal protein L17
MKHKNSVNHLGRTSSHRKAMLSNMASSLLLHKKITTTIAKAKALKTLVEPLITKAKEDTTHNRRTVFSYLENKEAVAELFREVVVKVGDRPGGYTRILRTGNRLGDNADMCIIELVDYNEAMLSAKDSKKKTSRRSRKSAPAAADKAEVAVAKTKTTAKAKPVVEEAKVVNEIENNDIEAKTE